MIHGFGHHRVGLDLLPRETVREALGRSEFHPGQPLVEVRETHAAWVFLAGDRVYKVRKPVRMEFPEFDALEQRRLACLAEVRANRDLASALGLSVRAIVPASGSFVLADDGAEDAVEYAVEMRRFDDAQTMESLAQRGRLTHEHVAAVARRLAAFHASAPRRSPIEPVWDVIRASQRNTRELLGLTSDHEARRVQALARFTNAFLLMHGREIAARAESGFIRDAHGDLRAAHVVFDKRLAIVGRLDLDPRQREADVAEDIACLVSDLERIGDQPVAELLVKCYWDAGGELCSPELLAFYGAQRALVRAKVELLRAQQLDDEAAATARERAAELLHHAERLAWRARGPIVLAIGGPAIGGPAVGGHATLAAELSRRSGLEVLSPDRLRKAHLWLAASATASESDYALDERARVYRALGERAREIVFDGHSVIVDATFGDQRLRAEFLVGLGDTQALYAFEYHAPSAGDRTCAAWDELRGNATLAIPPAAGVALVVDQIASWLDARTRPPGC